MIFLTKEEERWSVGSGPGVSYLADFEPIRAWHILECFSLGIKCLRMAFNRPTTNDQLLAGFIEW